MGVADRSGSKLQVRVLLLRQLNHLRVEVKAYGPISVLGEEPADRAVAAPNIHRDLALTVWDEPPKKPEPCDVIAGGIVGRHALRP
jgi:hypothetical protein